MSGFLETPFGWVEEPLVAEYWVLSDAYDELVDVSAAKYGEWGAAWWAKDYARADVLWAEYKVLQAELDDVFERMLEASGRVKFHADGRVTAPNLGKGSV